MVFVVSLVFCVWCLGFLTGCGESRPKTPTQGTYGQITASPSTNIAAAQPPPVPAIDGHPVLTCVQTELSPALLFQTKSDRISFFTGLDEHGLGPPSHAAFSGPNGPRIFKNGERLEIIHMEQNWVLVWFSGARGWTNGDIPCVVFLQHKPRSLQLDANGLHLRFQSAAGDIALLPLFGSYVAPTEGRDSPPQFSGKKIKTWDWPKVLTREPLMRVRYWAGALREFPIYGHETFSVDRSTDTVTIRRKMQWHSIDDDWATKPLKLNPISPALALASKDHAFPVKFSRPVMDLEMPSPHGPYMAAEGDAPLDATFSILQHVNELRGPQLTNSPSDYISLARSAYRAGNIDQYNYACYLFARAFTQQRFAHAARDYFPKYELPIPLFSPFAPVQTNSVPRERLIPSGDPSPFVISIEREVAGPNPRLVQDVLTAEGQWPLVTLRRTDKNSSDHHWPLGRVKVGAGTAPRKVVRAWQSPNTEKILLLD
jgi:hypothetical protein